MSTDLYFAYGSNMDEDQLRRRIGEVSFVSTGRIADHDLAFTRRGTYRPGGVSSIESARDRSVFGVVWRLSNEQLRQLDSIETTEAYQRQMMPIVFDDGRVVDCNVYVAHAQGRIAPDPDYLELIIAAARRVGLPRAYVARLEAFRSS